MTPVEVSDLLRFCSSVDPWLKQTSPEEGAVMVAGWGLLLEHVPAEFAMREARAHYSQGEARTITPGDLLTAWQVRQRREQQAETDAAHARSIQQALDAGEGLGEVVFGSGARYLADMMAAVERGEDPRTVPRPAGVRVRTLSPEAEARERACPWPDLCACTHLECRHGFLDEEETRVNGQGKVYPAVRRCPNCEDAVKMAEDRGLIRKPRRAYAGR